MEFLHEIVDASMLVQDASHRLVSDTNIDNWNRKTNVPFVAGTQTATTALWTGVANTVEALYDGLTIMYWLPRTSASNVTLNLTLKDGSTTGAINCYYSGKSRLTTHYAAGNIVVLTYIVNQLINGVAYTGWWAHAQYNTTYSVMTTAEIDAGTSTTGRVVSPQRLKYATDKLDITIGTVQPTSGWWYKEI